MIRRPAALLLGRFVAAGSLVALTACGSGVTVDSSQIPLVTPAPIAAADGTQVPLPPNVADGATASQRDRYAAQFLVPDKLSVHVPAAQNACGLMQGGATPLKHIRGFF